MSPLISAFHPLAPLAVAQEARPCCLAFQLTLERNGDRSQISRPVAGDAQAGKPQGSTWSLLAAMTAKEE